MASRQEILYIYNHIDELCYENRREILQMILYSGINKEKIVEKGQGTQVKFIDLDINLIHRLYTFIRNKIEN